MDERETEALIEAYFSARSVEFLLKEICAALLACGAITRMDIAGALLRAETVEALTKEYEVFTAVSPYLSMEMEDWSRRFGLEPNIDRLRKLASAWKMPHPHAPHPLEANSIAARFPSDAEGEPS